MSALRRFKHYATRKVSSFPNHSPPRLRLHINRMYPFRNWVAQNDARYARRMRYRNFLFLRSRHRDGIYSGDSWIDDLVPRTNDYGQVHKMDMEYGLLQGLADNRYWSPGDNAFSANTDVPTLPKSIARIPIRKTQYLSSKIQGTPNTEVSPTPQGYLQFSIPPQVMICVRRQQRREVLHALHIAGSRRKQKAPKWNEDSYIRC